MKQKKSKKKKKGNSWKRGVSLREHRRLVKKYSGLYLPTPGKDETVVAIFIRKK